MLIHYISVVFILITSFVLENKNSKDFDLNARIIVCTLALS